MKEDEIRAHFEGIGAVTVITAFLIGFLELLKLMQEVFVGVREYIYEILVFVTEQPIDNELAWSIVVGMVTAYGIILLMEGMIEYGGDSDE